MSLCGCWFCSICPSLRKRKGRRRRIYTKLFSGKDACEKYYKLIGRNLPAEGKVDIITITDKQYENIISYTAAEKTPKKQQEQLLLF